jgi:hypothetical protein
MTVVTQWGFTPWQDAMHAWQVVAMKTRLFLFAAVTFLSLPACKRDKPLTEKAKDSINDGLDRRPGEKARDAAEDAADAVKEAGNEVNEAVKDATSK